jgi:hypothetical protein
VHVEITPIRVLLWLALVLALHLQTAEAFQQPLNPALRARVEKLKVDLTRAPTNSTNRLARAEVIWDWANAHALNGGYLPVELTLVVGRMLSQTQASESLDRALDAYVRELTLADESPEVFGSINADPGPFEARSFATIRQHYVVGSRGIERGGGFLVARHFMTNFGPWQSDDAAADNYVSITTSNARVRLDTDTVPLTGMHGGFRQPLEQLVFRVIRGRLEPGDEVIITYGDTAGGGRGMLMPSFSSDRMPLPVYLSLDDRDQWLSLPIQPIAVIGGPVAGVHGFAPSIVAPGEAFTLSVRAEDAHYNRATGATPEWRVLVNGATNQLIPANRGPITHLELRIDTPGVHRISIESVDGKIRGDVNPILVEPEPTQRVYWGDTHGHSGFAEGIGTPERFMTWARDDARLDFVTHSEHDIWMDDAEWEVLRANVAQYSNEGTFVAFLGYEWTARNLAGGHHNVLFRDPAGRARIPVQRYPTLSSLYQGLRARHHPNDVVVIPHAHQAADYRMSDPALEPLVEIMSQHGSFEWFARMYLNHGHRVGFTAASDNHLSQPGYSAPQGGSLSQRGGLGAVLAPTRTRDAIFDAMKNLRAYATTGERIILDFSVNEAGMGQRAPFAPERHLAGRIIGTAPIDTIAVVRNGELIWERDLLSAVDGGFEDEELFQLTFSSASTPDQRGDNPRGWRPWRGTIQVEDAELIDVTGTDFSSVLLHRLETDPEEPGLIRFATHTRGDTSSIRLRLKGVRNSTTVSVALEPGREFGGGPTIYRPHASLAASTTALRVADLQDSQTRAVLQSPNYSAASADAITLRRIITDGPFDAEFELMDTSTRQGDYYYVRVTQANDASAWSSPIWVGGYPPR